MITSDLLSLLASGMIIHHNDDVANSERCIDDDEAKNIYFTDKQVERLERKSKEEGLPEAEIVRRALDAYLAWDDPTYRPLSLSIRKERRMHPTQA
jgi:hypothetical protein